MTTEEIAAQTVNPNNEAQALEIWEARLILGVSNREAKLFEIRDFVLGGGDINNDESLKLSREFGALDEHVKKCESAIKNFKWWLSCAQSHEENVAQEKRNAALYGAESKELTQ